jgi:hypothetical protein
MHKFAGTIAGEEAVTGARLVADASLKPDFKRNSRVTPKLLQSVSTE